MSSQYEKNTITSITINAKKEVIEDALIESIKKVSDNHGIEASIKASRVSWNLSLNFARIRSMTITAITSEIQKDQFGKNSEDNNKPSPIPIRIAEVV
jgi:predicted DNA-binding ribbon-helix-helix protein